MNYVLEKATFGSTSDLKELSEPRVLCPGETSGAVEEARVCCGFDSETYSSILI